MPMARMLMATPETMWSTRNVMVATAWRAAAATPAAIAVSSPAAGPHWSAPQAPNQVPKIIMPSMPMLTMPERSLNTPPRVARYKGTNARRAEAMVASPNSWTRISGTVVLLPELAAGGHAPHHLVGDHDGEDDHALHDVRDLLGDVGVEPDPGRGPVQERDQQGRGHDPPARVAAEQGDGDAGEAVAADVVQLHAVVDADHVLEGDQAGDRPRQQHRLHDHGVAADAGRLGRPRVGAQHPQLEPEAGAAYGQRVQHRGHDGEHEEPGHRGRPAEVEADRVEERDHGPDLGRRLDRGRLLLGDGALLVGVLERPRQQVQQDRVGHEVHHDGRDDLVGPAVDLEQGRDRGPEDPAGHPGQDGQGQVDDGRGRQPVADVAGGQGADGVLALNPDVEQPGLEGDGHGQAGEDQRGGPAEDERDRVAVEQPVVPHGAGHLGHVAPVPLDDQDDQDADDGRDHQRDGRGEQLQAPAAQALAPGDAGRGLLGLRLRRRALLLDLHAAGSSSPPRAPVMYRPSSLMVASAPRNWATMRPSWMTPTRSARARISSRLEEISSTATPSSRASTSSCQMNWVAPMSRPRVGWAAISSLGWLSNSRPRTSFCWLPPDRA